MFIYIYDIHVPMLISGQTIFLPVVGLVPTEQLKPGELVV